VITTNHRRFDNLEFPTIFGRVGGNLPGDLG
jgi:hypothetical protein